MAERQTDRVIMNCSLFSAPIIYHLRKINAFQTWIYSCHLRNRVIEFSATWHTIRYVKLAICSQAGAEERPKGTPKYLKHLITCLQLYSLFVHRGINILALIIYRCQRKDDILHLKAVFADRKTKMSTARSVTYIKRAKLHFGLHVALLNLAEIVQDMIHVC